MSGTADSNSPVPGADQQRRAGERAERPAAPLFRNILIATDLSECSDSPLRYAIEIARRHGATLHLFHWIDPTVYRTVGEGTLKLVCEAGGRSIHGLQTELAARGFPPNLRHEAHVHEGELAAVLAQVTGNHHIDLIVVGTHGRSGWKKLVLGSVAERIFRLAPCPVLTVGPNVMRPRPAEHYALRRILFPTDFSPQSQAAEPYAFSEMEKFGARLTVLHVIAHPPRDAAAEQRRVQKAEEQLRSLAERHPAALDRTELIVEAGAPADAVLETAERQGADLIVLGVRSPRALADRLMWPNAYRIVCESQCPVLCVRGPA